MNIDALFNVGVAGLLGLLIGSFLNVVIHRLPKMMEAQWSSECAAHLGQPDPLADQPRQTLVTPRSSCPTCGTAIRWYHNIPLISYVLLRGRCAYCSALISVRYPLVELATGVLFAWCGWKWGLSVTSACWAFFCALLIALAAIDWDTTLLPDDLTLPLLWVGLCVSALGWNKLPLDQALWGAVAGYLSLWSVYWAFKLATGKEGMGYGDFKLFAALGAWFGWTALIPIILLASTIGAVVGIALKFGPGLREGKYVPFGPFLALGGLAALYLGPEGIASWFGA